MFELIERLLPSSSWWPPPLAAETATLAACSNCSNSNIPAATATPKQQHHQCNAGLLAAVGHALSAHRSKNWLKRGEYGGLKPVLLDLELPPS